MGTDVTTTPPREPLVLDGGLEAELARRGVVLRPHPGAAPLPVREPEAMRSAHLDAALAGANVVTAATGGLHRRALARTGDARRAREWAHAALALARDAAAEASDRGRNGGTDDAGGLRAVRVATVAGPLEGRGPGTAELDGMTAAQEHRAHAAILADGGAEILRIEGMGSVQESEAAVRAGLEAGLDVWSGVRLAEARDGVRLAGGGVRLAGAGDSVRLAGDEAGLAERGLSLPSGEPLGAWLDAMAALPVAAVVVEGPSIAAVRAAVRAAAARVDEAALAAPGSTLVRVGAILPPGTGDRYATARLLRDGAALVGPGDDGSPGRIAAIRSVVDRHLSKARATREAEEAGWTAWLAEGTERAAGRALWLSAARACPDVRSRLEWTAAAPGDLSRLPVESFALVAIADPVDVGAVSHIVDRLDRGGWLLVAAGGDVADAFRRDGRIEWMAPTDPRPGSALGWIGRRRP